MHQVIGVSGVLQLKYHYKMAKRIITKIGDVFCVEVGTEYKCYFQYVANDKTVLNSSVIRVFKTKYPMDYEPILNDIIKDDVFFYAHTILHFGISFNAWYRVGKHNEVGNIEDIWFRWFDDVDYSNKTKSFTWSIWKINQEPIFVGGLDCKYSNYDLGVVFSYDNIVNKIAKGVFLLKSVD